MMSIDDIFRGQMTAQKWRALGEYLRGQRIFAGQGVRLSKDRNGILIAAKLRDWLQPPQRIFWPTLHIDDSGETPAYTVTVSFGLVNERDITKGDGVDAMKVPPWECPSRLDGEDEHEFTITNGQSVYVRVFETSSGAIGPSGVDPAVDIVIATTGTESTNYINGVQEGVYYYELAKFTVTDDIPDLEMVLAGGHIFHTSGLTCDVRVLTCDPDSIPATSGEGYEPAQLLRMSFVSGRIAAVGDTVAARPLSPVVEECNVSHCS
jgi:hypothetical protein